MTTKLKELFMCSHQELKAKLLGVAAIPHQGEKGDASENDWREFLKNFLPSRYAVDKAFVVDVEGNYSEQIDIVIYDKHFSPLLLDRGGVRFLLAESVYAVFEVKQEVNKPHIDYAGKKVSSVRRMKRTSGTIVDRGMPKEARPLPRILGGILASRSEWKDPMGEYLEQALKSLDDDNQLDLGIALQHGAFEVPPNRGAMRRSTTDTPLTFFLFALLRRIKDMGTVPAIDWSKYEEAL
jgi:hypothetical protein